MDVAQKSVGEGRRQTRHVDCGVTAAKRNISQSNVIRFAAAVQFPKPTLTQLNMSAHPLSAAPSVTSLKVDDYEPLLSAIVEHERLARFKGFTADNAFELGTAIRSLFLERYAGKEVGIVIRIQLFGGHNLFGCVVGDAPAVNKSNWYADILSTVLTGRNWARGKANTVLTMHKSSLRVGRE